MTSEHWYFIMRNYIIYWILCTVCLAKATSSFYYKKYCLYIHYYKKYCFKDQPIFFFIFFLRLMEIKFIMIILFNIYLFIYYYRYFIIIYICFIMFNYWYFISFFILFILVYFTSFITDIYYFIIILIFNCFHYDLLII